MIERKAEKKVKNWIARGNDALLITGARQIGKTYLIRECLEKGWTGLGYKTVEFEEKWKEYTGLENAHFLNSATVGLHIAIKILKSENNWSDSDEIISTPFTFVSSNHAIAYENMKVVFADVDQYLCLDPEDIKRKITDKTRTIDI